MKKYFFNKYFNVSAILLIVCLVIFTVLNFAFPIKIEKDFSQHILDKNGETIHIYLTKDDKWRLKTELNEISETLQKAIIHKEDKYFFYHYGINPIAVIRALFYNVFTGKRTSGASTITMQVARLLNPKARTYKNKIVEIFRAVQIENKFTKQEILQLYLNLVPYGGNVEGVKSASVLYLNKMPNHLSLAEITALSIIPNRPTSLKLATENKFIVTERNKWLQRFEEENLFDKKIIKTAITEPFNVTARNVKRLAPHFSRKIISENPTQLNIKTTLDLNTQLTLEEIVKNYTNRLKSLEIQNSAVLVLDNKANEVVAYIGSADFFNNKDAGQVDGIAAIRSPGSTLKPLIFAMAFDKGITTPKQKISDLPIDFSGYSPSNFNRDYAGLVTAEMALQKSLNIPAVNLLDKLKTENLIDKLTQMNFHQIKKDKNKLGLSLALGGCGVSLKELTNYFSIFTNKGIWRPVKTLKNEKNNFEKEIISESAAYLITNILSEIERPDFPKKSANIANTPNIAWKTGTSYGRKDAWSIGYNQQFTIGVWVGNFSSKGIPELTGSSIATPLLFEIFNEISQNKSLQNKRPKALKSTWICSETGKIPTAECENQILDLYINQKSKHQKCDHQKEQFVNAAETICYCKHCLPTKGNYKTKFYKNYPNDLVSYYEETKTPYEKLPKHNPKCEKYFGDKNLKIISPKTNITYYLMEEENQEIQLKCESNADVSETFWYINDKFYKSTNANESTYFTPTNGETKVTCVDDKGRKKSVIMNVELL